MVTARHVLDLLTRDELLHLVDHHGVIGDVRQLSVPLPPRAEQDAISVPFESIVAVERENGEELEAIRQTKSALMSVLLTGEVRVTPDEGAV